MKIRFYSVYDKAADRYLDPFTAPTDAVAERGFSDAVNKEGHPFNLHPEDYVLVECGEFDPESGFIVANGVRTLVAGYQLERSPDRLGGEVAEVDIKGLRDAVAIQQEQDDAN